MTETTRIRRQIQKSATTLRATRIIAAGLLIVFAGMGVISAVHRHLLAAGLSLLLAIVCAGVLFFCFAILGGLPELDEQLKKDDKSHHRNRHRDASRFH